MARQKDFITESVTITAETQAERVNNLLALTGLNGKEQVKFSEIAEFVKDRKLSLSRSSWHAIQNPEYRYVRYVILQALELFFETPPGFLMKQEVEGSPEYVEQLDFMTKARMNETFEQFYRHSKSYPSDVFLTEMENFYNRIAAERGNMQSLATG